MENAYGETYEGRMEQMRCTRRLFKMHYRDGVTKVAMVVSQLIRKHYDAL